MVFGFAWSDLRMRLNRYRWAGLLTAIMVATVSSLVIYLLIDVVVGPPRSITNINARTEVIQYRVTNETISRIEISAIDNKGKCVNYVEPQIADIVVYTLASPGLLKVTLLTDRDGIITNYSVQYNQKCGFVKPTRIPIWGPGRIGGNYRDGHSPILLDGDFTIYGRSEGGFVYPAVTDPIAIPGGSIIATPDNYPAPSKSDSGFYGSADVGEQALSAHISTYTPLFEVTFPGGGLPPLQFRVGIFTRLFSDPQFLYIEAFLLVGLAVFQLFKDAKELVQP